MCQWVVLGGERAGCSEELGYEEGVETVVRYNIVEKINRKINKGMNKRKMSKYFFLKLTGSCS